MRSNFGGNTKQIFAGGTISALTMIIIAWLEVSVANKGPKQSPFGLKICIDYNMYIRKSYSLSFKHNASINSP